MFKKLSNSLVSPKDVAKYYGESFGKTFLFFLVMLLFLMVITFVNLVTTNALTDNVKKEIKKSFVNEEIAFVIEEGVLKGLKDDASYVYTNKVSEKFYIVFTEDIQKSENPVEGISIVFSKDGVYAKYQIAVKVMEYTEFEYLKNIDFSDKELLSDINFWDNMFGIAEKVIENYKPIYLVSNTIYYLLYWSGWMMMFALIIAFFSKMRTNGLLSYGSLFKLTIYNLSPFVMCLIFATLFNLGFLVYIGYLLTAVFNIITVNEVLKKLYLNRNEGQ